MHKLFESELKFVKDRNYAVKIFQSILPLFVLLALATELTVGAGLQLPIRRYTIADGLARDYVLRIRRDSRGFLWFGTAEGLSRFDGYEFHNYTTDDGLPNRQVNDFLETSDGNFWVATGGGIAKFNPNGYSPRSTSSATDNSKNPFTDEPREPMFTVYKISDDVSTNYAGVLFEDSHHQIWAGSSAGLFKIAPEKKDSPLEFVEVGRSASNIDPNAPTPVIDIAEDGDGNLWIATLSGLFRKPVDGAHLDRFTTENNLPDNEIRNLSRAADGSLLVGTNKGLCRLVAHPQSGENVVARAYSLQDGLPEERIRTVRIAADGALWVGTRDGIYYQTFSTDGKPSEKFHKVENENLTQPLDINQDDVGNIWIGTEHSAFKLNRNGLASFDISENGEVPRPSQFFENAAGELFFLGDDTSQRTNLLYRFDGESFAGVLPKSIHPFARPSWGNNHTVFQDRYGEWWFATDFGAFRYPSSASVENLKTARPVRVFTTQDGFSSNEVFHIYEDSRGDVWMNTFGNAPWLHRWERATDKVVHYLLEEEYKQFGGPTTYGEDADGNLWMGYFNGSVSRYRDGKFTRFTVKDNGVPTGQVRDFFLDSRKRLWMATGGGGIALIENPDSDQPHFKIVSTLDGLSSSSVNDITEDQYGRLYLAGARGVDRYEPETNRVKRFTIADGLAENNVALAYRDRQNNIWFATQHSIARLQPEAPRPASAETTPYIFISRLQIGERDFPLSELGAEAISNLKLAPDQNRLQIDFASISYASGEVLQYQYRLLKDFDNNKNEENWSVPTTKRSVSFASLAPGDYLFEVRAINSEGAISRQPARITFTLPPPVWRRWWFISLVALIVLAAIFALDRYRVKKTREVKNALDKSVESEERFRTLAQTASDAIVTIDRDSKILYANQAIEKIFGYSSNELLGSDITVLMPESLRSSHYHGLERYYETGEKHIPWSAVELAGQHRDGHEIPLEISFGEFTRDGRKYFTGIIRDVTERRRAEEEIQRAREERLRELERVRKRIATDLHDDIGSSLTQISLLSEVVRQRVGDDNGKNKTVSEPLSMIANASREVIDSMSDIVWAINPQKDHLGDLTQRMRRFAADIFTMRNIEFEWRASGNAVEEDVPLGANVRREIFLIFKELVNNIVKHADCTRVDIDLILTRYDLELRLRDDGRGFDTAVESEGHGLMSMRDRVAGLGGRLEMNSEIGVGSQTFLEISLDRGE